MAACDLGVGTEEGMPRGPPSSPFMGLDPRKEEAVRQLLNELHEELHGKTEEKEASSVDCDAGEPLGDIPETPGLRKQSGGCDVCFNGKERLRSHDNRPLSLWTLESSLELATSTADAASLFASSALLRASLWDSTNYSCNNSPSAALSAALAPGGSGHTAATSADTTPSSLPTCAPAAEQWESLPIPEEEAALPWAYITKGLDSGWGPSRNPFVATEH
ncbi:hypothetical protein cyc_01146 [Cyclospora cayetanensis]|uniref:Uncharacterized protein n=1 Tax=Cyclospora cayetanensis TaxID=88456 RepID=A0A1D3DA07_9EIME|nr:hypothetical protein cyc_01146 [Cyclospora cayetanensis]